MTTTGVVVLVDVYAPNRRIAPEFIAAGYRCVRVQSTVSAPPVYGAEFSLDEFVANIVHEGDLAETVRRVAAHEPVAVVAGGELGVALADQISAALGLPTANGTELSAARRNKYLQTETVRAAGLRATRQLLVTEESRLVDRHREMGGRIVVKPLQSAGGDGVTFCESPEESAAAYRKILASKTIFAADNSAVLAQEYLVGAEFVVNTVSRDGRHQVTDIWRYTKTALNGLTDLISGAYLMPRKGTEQEALVGYALSVLDALGIRHGPAHFEIKLTPEGPCLVEVGARLSGLDKPYYARVGTGHSQLDWLVDAYVRPERFHAKAGSPYQVEKFMAVATLASPYEGVLESYPLLDEVRLLESFHDLKLVVQPGGRIRKTVDDLSWPVIVGLAHPVQEIVMRDLNTLHYLDGRGFYALENQAGGPR